jgi:hypothetical protein
MALRDISHARNDKVAFGVKWTSMGAQRWVAQSRLTRFGHASVDDLMATCEAFGGDYFWYRNCLGISEMRG